MVALVYISNMLGSMLDSAFVAEQAHKVDLPAAALFCLPCLLEVLQYCQVICNVVRSSASWWQTFLSQWCVK